MHVQHAVHACPAHAPRPLLDRGLPIIIMSCMIVILSAVIPVIVIMFSIGHLGEYYREKQIS